MWTKTWRCVGAGRSLAPGRVPLGCIWGTWLVQRHACPAAAACRAAHSACTLLRLPLAPQAFREGRYNGRDGWHEGMEVERGMSRQRIDLQHGFMRDIVRVLCARAAALQMTMWAGAA